VLYKVTIGQDVYLGTPDEIVGFMAKADGAPPGDAAGYMRGIAERVAISERHAAALAVETGNPLAFLTSLAALRLLRLEQRHETKGERVDPKSALGEGPVAFGENVSLDDLRRDVLDRDGD
jgi:hypothetical protein